MELKQQVGGSVRKGMFWAIMASTMWGISGTVLQFISQNQHIPASWFLSTRTIGAGVVLLIISFMRYRMAIFDIFRSWRLIGWLLAYAVFGLMANLLTFYMSVQTGTAAAATILQYLSPLFIVVGSLVFKHEKPFRSDLIAFVVSALGVFLAITKGDVSQLAIPMNALLWGIGSGITAASTSFYHDPSLRRGTRRWSFLAGGPLSPVSCSTVTARCGSTRRQSPLNLCFRLAR